MFKVDHRETKCKQLAEEQKVDVTYENLVYGDFQLLDAQGQIKFIFERKTNADLLASIKDGRYKNQKAKLFGAGFKPSQIYYVIEGSVSFTNTQNQQNKILQGAVINTLMRDKIGCFVTKSTEETWQLICNIAKRVREEPDKYKTESQEIEAQTVVETSATDSTKVVFHKMLCQVPSVSDKTAAELVIHWDSLYAMMTHLGSMTPEERHAHLSAIKINGRKCSSRVVEQICKTLF